MFEQFGPRLIRTLMLPAGVLAVGMASQAFAAETATSFYLLGSKGSMAGMTPPPGMYLADLSYYYSGSASGEAALGVTLPRTGARDSNGVPLTVDAKFKVSGEAYYQIPTALWVAPGQVMGGNFGVSLATPFGWKGVVANIDAAANFTIPKLGTTLTAGRSLSLDDDRAGFGDPIVGAFLGWHQGNLHWNFGTMINVPAGVWDKDRLANIGFNH
ncbi:MAG: transporter, partial [Proteobacteria bacterium]|nr:transporter [Pseudomonadota bacterium]